MRPIVAVTAGTLMGGANKDQPRDFVNRVYSDAIRRARGAPAIVPLSCDADAVRAALAPARGLLITGGLDIHPREYGEDVMEECGEIDELRDTTDRIAIEAARELGLPILGICRGIQAMAVYFGGALFQDIPEQVEDALPHRQEAARHKATHSVTVDRGTRLAEAVGAGRLDVNTFHHQAVKVAPAGFRVTALAPDGVIEAIEAEAEPWRVGVQWHPEEMAPVNETQQALFAAFVKAMG